MSSTKRYQDSSPEAEDDAPGISKRVRWDNEETAPNSATSETSHSEDASNQKTFVAITGSHGRVGGACYNPTTATLHLMEDTMDGSHFDLARMFLEQAKPEMCLVSSRADEPLILLCQEFMELAGGQCQVRPHREFVAQKGSYKLQQLRILSELPRSEVSAEDRSASPSAPRNAREFMDSRRHAGDPTTQRLNASIRQLNFGGDRAPLCMASVASLLDQLLRVHSAEELDEAQHHIGALDVSSIEILALDQVMQINADALSSLQIFDDENHASVHSDKTKEGHSLFQLINHTSTHLGRALLRRWCLRPSLSIPTINARHAAIECLSHPDNITVSNSLRSNMRGLCQVPKAMALLRTGRGRLSEWRGIAKFAYHVILLRDTLGELAGWEEIATVQQLLTALDGVSLEETGTLINTIIDWHESQNTQRICVNPGIDEALDDKKRVYSGLDDLLIQVARQVSNTIPEDYANELRVLYFPQLGYLIRTMIRPEWTTDEDFEQLPGWSFQFKTDENIYYKSQEMKDLDIYVGDLHSYIAAFVRIEVFEDSEIEIIEKTLERVLKYDKEIISVCEAAAEVDCLLSLSFSTMAHGWVKPEMTEDNVLEIKDGIHPLQNLLVPTFVPNDAHVAGGRGIGVDSDGVEEDIKSIMICTGANACGKSVYLKQNALIPFMAQIGCFVPAQSARLGIVDKIFTRVQTREGVSKLQSSFMIDLAQVSLALRNSTSRSIIVMDEFGKGSLSTDGAGLFAGVIIHLLKRGDKCPKVFASTHFHELFTRGLLSPSLPISYAYMNVLLTNNGNTSSEAQEDQTEITYLYRVASGLCLDSYAAQCARRYGLKAEIVERARFVSDVMSRNEIGLLLDEEMTEEETNELEVCAEVCKRFVGWKMSSEDGVSVKERLRQVLAV
ncbi:hypothetical protein BDV93DRAFT_486860 [Ceratobasidium sp. AG-I]|nr:hypothetical protein BDV93DRAFT_486860 [Ceratobasidium sp. AG-I]